MSVLIAAIQVQHHIHPNFPTGSKKAMVFLYNLIQIPALILFSPLLFVKAIMTAKYRQRIPGRLGSGLGRLVSNLPQGRPRIWIHALSVGEVTSSLPLVRALRKAHPDGILLYSATTMTGEELAEKSLADEIDLFIPFPLDIVCITDRFIRLADPDLFILVETDFWPNFLAGLKRRNIPLLLVNGRISRKSHSRFLRFRSFFLPLFSCFSLLSMQTMNDAENMQQLGVSADRILTLGNLKYDALMQGSPSPSLTRKALTIPDDKIVLLAGSTHEGEEAIIFDLFKQLRRKYPLLYLIIAPRRVDRAEAVRLAALKSGLHPCLRSDQKKKDNDDTDVLILDTIGELASLYAICDLAFVGGSLVDAGGHNPLEPAVHGKPVLFGSHMEDFSEIAEDLVQCGGAFQCAGKEDLYQHLDSLLANPEAAITTGSRADDMVRMHQGVIGRHLKAITTLLEHKDGKAHG